MDTTNKHIGNLLYRMTDKDLYEVLEQYMNKHKFTLDRMLNNFREIMLADGFDYNGDRLDNWH